MLLDALFTLTLFQRVVPKMTNIMSKASRKKHCEARSQIILTGYRHIEFPNSSSFKQVSLHCLLTVTSLFFQHPCWKNCITKMTCYFLKVLKHLRFKSFQFWKRIFIFEKVWLILELKLFSLKFWSLEIEWSNSTEKKTKIMVDLFFLRFTVKKRKKVKKP